MGPFTSGLFDAARITDRDMTPALCWAANPSRPCADSECLHDPERPLHFLNSGHWQRLLVIAAFRKAPSSCGYPWLIGWTTADFKSLPAFSSAPNAANHSLIRLKSNLAVSIADAMKYYPWPSYFLTRCTSIIDIKNQTIHAAKDKNQEYA